MTIRLVQCSLCNGTGRCERREVLVGDEWITGKQADSSEIEGPERWVDCDCPRCGARGAIEVEYVRCKIF